MADGNRMRIAPQFYYYVGRFGLLGEYTKVSQDVARTTTAGRRTANLDTTAWQLAASVFLTGEEESFRGFKPINVFSLANHTWGAFELVARYHVLDPDDDAFLGGAASFADPAVSARKASAVGLGLNWYLNENLKWVLDYEQTSFEGGAAAGEDRDDESVFLTRFALGF
jgi:phosphate-selective porin OprO/OprP